MQSAQNFLLNPDDCNVTIATLNAAAVGTINTAVLRFTGTPSTDGNIPIATWATIASSDADGTSIKILRPGLYLVELEVPIPASSAVMLGISMDATVAQRLAAVNPSRVALPGVFRASSGVWTIPAATDVVASLVALIPINQRLANDPAGGFIRFHANDGAAGALSAADVTIAGVSCRLQRAGDLNSGS